MLMKTTANPQASLEWYALFQTLCRKLHIDFNLQVEGEEIVIRSSQQNINTIIEHMKLALADAGNFKHFLPYQIGDRKPVDHPTPYDEKLLKVPAPANTIECGREILSNIFGFAFRELSFNSNGLFDNDASVNNKVLWSKPIQPWVKNVWQEVIKATIAKYDGANLHTLRRAWHGDNTDLRNLNPDTRDVVIARGQLQQIMGCTEDRDSNDQARCRLFFDFGRAYEMLFMPILKPQQSPQADADGHDYELRIGIAHLMTYLQVLIEDGVMFRMFRNSQDAERINARPIFLTSRDIVDLQNLLVLVIDCSGSMIDDLPRLIGEVKSYLVELRKKDPEARVRLIPFNVNVASRLECSVAQEAQINAFLDKLTADQNTALYSTVNDELTHLVGQKIQNNIRMVIFTDGRDNNSGNDWGYFKSLISTKIIALNKTASLQIFPVGAGDVNTAALEAMATTCGSQYVYCQSASDLGESLQSVVRTAPLKKFLDFMVQLRQSTQTFSLPIPQHGGPHMPEISFAMLPSEQMSINKGANDQVDIKVYNVNEIPTATLVDDLMRLRQEALTIARDAGRSHDARISAVDDVVNRISSLRTNLKSESLLVANVKYDVEGYIAQLKKAKENSNFAASTTTLFSAASGVASITGQAPPSPRSFGQNSNN